jgi:hypothetical protein
MAGGATNDKGGRDEPRGSSTWRWRRTYVGGSTIMHTMGCTHQGEEDTEQQTHQRFSNFETNDKEAHQAVRLSKSGGIM